MPDFDIFSEEFSRQAAEDGNQARLQLLKQGIPVFYRDEEINSYVMEQSDGRKFEIRYLPGAPGDCNYEIVRELRHSSAA
jgi:hypothetical protein